MEREGSSVGKSLMQTGVFYAILSYFIWGVLPIYWKQMEQVDAMGILVNRIFWSFIFSLLLVLGTRKGKALLQTLKDLQADKRQAILIITASILISLNWLLFIWAVNSGYITETSLGYYINPLISMLLGVLFLKEKLSSIQIVSFCLATLGVLILTFGHGSFPFIALGLAISFGFYGLCKKSIPLEPAIGLVIETFFALPIPLLYVIYTITTGNGGTFVHSFGTHLFLIGSGLVTILPLLLFARGIQLIPMTLMGILQYIAPTITLLLGVLMYGEPFSQLEFIAFLFIWGALALFSASNFRLDHAAKRTSSDKSMT